MSHSAAYSILAAIAVGLVNFFLTRMRDAEEKSAKTTVRAIGSALADSGRSGPDPGIVHRRGVFIRFCL